MPYISPISAAMNKFFIYARACVNKKMWAFFLTWLQSCRLLRCSAVSLLFKIWTKPAKNCLIFQSALTFYVPIQQATKIKPNLKKLASCAFRKFVARGAAANFGRETFTGNRKATSWSLTTIKGKIFVFIVVFKFVMHFCYRRTIWLNQEHFSCNNKTNYTRRQIYYS